MIIPGQPLRGTLHDLAVMLLQGHQVGQHIDPGLPGRGDDAAQHAGHTGTVGGGKEPAVLALAKHQLQGTFDDMVVERCAADPQKLRQLCPMRPQIAQGLRGCWKIPWRAS